MAEAGWEMVRYADDFVILCRTAEDAQEALAVVQAWVMENGLTLHSTKTREAEINRPSQPLSITVSLRDDLYRLSKKIFRGPVAIYLENCYKYISGCSPERPLHPS